MKHLKKCIILLLLSVAFLNIFTAQARADMGPKPSITLHISNAPSEYYVALATNEFTKNMPETEFVLKTVTDESVKEYLKNFYYQGWYFFESPVGTNVFKNNEKNKYEFTYMVPNPFKVIIITMDGVVTLSEEIYQEEYNAEVTYNFATGKLKEKEGGNTVKRITFIIICYLLTLLLEMIVMRLFGFPLDKGNVIRFVIINTITQLGLNKYIVDHAHDGLALIFGCFLNEIMIIIIEGVAYGLTLLDSNGQKRYGKCFLLSLAGNMFSVFIGIVILFMYGMITNG